MDKLCPFCGSDKTARCKVESHFSEESFDRVECDDCGSYADEKWWNNRPHEKKLKEAIDVLLRAVSFVQDEKITWHIRINRAKESILTVKKLLGVKK